MPPRQSGQRKLVDALSPLARSVRKRWERERTQRRVEADKARKKMRGVGKQKKEKMIMHAQPTTGSQRGENQAGPPNKPQVGRGIKLTCPTHRNG